MLTGSRTLTPNQPGKSVVIFGNGGIASLAWYCLTHDSPHKVLAFTLNQDYLTQSITGTPTHEGLPLVPFEQLPSMYPAEQVSLLFALGNREINGLRRARYEQAKAMGYSLLTYVSSRAITWPDLQTGDNCMIYEQTVIQPFATIGNNVIIRSSVHVSHHCEIGNHCYIAPGVTLSGNVKLGEQVFLGVGSVIRDGVTLADRTFVGAGSVVVTDTEPGCAYIGNPARKIVKSSLEVTTT